MQWNLDVLTSGKLTHGEIDLKWPKKKYKKINPCQTTYKMEDNDASSWSTNILDQLEFIWPRYDHNNDFFLSNVKWHIKWKVINPVANPLTF